MSQAVRANSLNTQSLTGTGRNTLDFSFGPSALLFDFDGDGTPFGNQPTQNVWVELGGPREFRQVLSFFQEGQPSVFLTFDSIEEATGIPAQDVRSIIGTQLNGWYTIGGDNGITVQGGFGEDSFSLSGRGHAAFGGFGFDEFRVSGAGHTIDGGRWRLRFSVRQCRQRSAAGRRGRRPTLRWRR
jgi:hypothetical protein